MQRLIVCADGTWNAEHEDGKGDNTNVVKTRRCVRSADDAGVPQVVFYHNGVGTGGWWDRMTGGAFGSGIGRNIKDCYRFLVERFTPGDELYFFGFSRGAYTVRSLAGLVRNAGILRREHAARIDEAYDLYRDRDDNSRPSSDKAVAFRERYAVETRIKFVGVWDTVGALGVPTRGPIGWISRQRHGFHDVRLSSRVENAFHALAVDERRKPFAPTLWEVRADDPALADGRWRVEQRWFAGVHSNVGGGYPNAGLSNLALRWILRAAEQAGLAVDHGFLDALDPQCDCGGELYDSMNAMYKAFGPHVRPLDEARVDPETKAPLKTFEEVDSSVVERAAKGLTPKYLPENLLHYWRRNPDKWAPEHRPPA